VLCGGKAEEWAFFIKLLKTPNDLLDMIADVDHEGITQAHIEKLTKFKSMEKFNVASVSNCS
jgi:hypothetical protein